MTLLSHPTPPHPPVYDVVFSVMSKTDNSGGLLRCPAPKIRQVMASHDKSTYSWPIPKFPSRGHGLALILEDLLEPLREFRRLADTRGDGGSGDGGDGGDGGELGMMGTSATSCGPEVERSRVTGNSCHAIIFTSNDIRYPLVNVYITMERSTMFNG